MRWHRSDRFDPRAVALADRHYSRQKPGTNQFMPPGRTLVFLTADGDAVWGSSWPEHQPDMRGDGTAWKCTIFRNEAPARYLSSELIREALAATRALWGDPPIFGTITYVDVSAVRPKRDPGYCFVVAGFIRMGYSSRRGYLRLWLPASMHPSAEQPCDSMMRLVV